MTDLKERLRGHVAALEGERCPATAPEAHARAREYVRDFLARYGEVRGQDFGEGVNLILDLGEGPPRTVVGAHYDTVPGSPGADDNASAVAVMLETVRRFAEAGAPRAVRFVGFDMEEWGMIGGAALAKEMRRGGEEIDVMLSLEMVGCRRTEPGSQRYPPFLKYFYPDRGDFIGLISNRKAKGAMKRLGERVREAGVAVETLVAPMKGWLVPETRLSDHSPFWDQGFPAIMMTDTAFLRNPHYHGPGDTMEKLDFDFMAGICDGLCAWVAGG